MKDMPITDQDIQEALAKSAGEIKIGLGEDIAFGFSGKSEDFLRKNNETQNGGNIIAEIAKQKAKGEETLKARALQISETDSIASLSTLPHITSGFNTFSDDLGYMPGAELNSSVYNMNFTTDTREVSQAEMAFRQAAEGEVLAKAKATQEFIARNAEKGFTGPLRSEYLYVANANIAGEDVLSDADRDAAITRIAMEQEGYLETAKGEYAVRADVDAELNEKFKSAHEGQTPVEPLKTVTTFTYSESPSVNNFNAQATPDQPENFVELRPEAPAQTWEFDFNG